MKDSNATTRGLVQHKRAAHEGVKYPSNQCDEQFSWKCSVPKHQLTVQYSPPAKNTFLIVRFQIFHTCIEMYVQVATIYKN